MLSLAQVAPIVSEGVEVKRFKPWWEYITDYATHFLLWLGLMSWTNVLNDDASGVKCVLQNTTKAHYWNSIYARFCSQRCALELYDGVLVHYPYLLFLQWIVLLFIQILWLKLPFVSSKLEAMHKIIEGIKNQKANTDINKINKNFATNARINKQCKDQPSIEEARLQFLLEDTPTCNLCEVYYLKCISVFTISASFCVCIFKGFPKFIRLHHERNIKCIFAKTNQECPPQFCHLESGRLVFGLIIANLTVLGIFSIISLSALLVMHSKAKRINKQFSPYVRGKRGWSDVCFALCLMNLDLRRGAYLLKDLKKCIPRTSSSNEVFRDAESTSFNI